MSKLALKQTYYIRAPPSAVFAAISESSGLTKWLLEYADITPKRGAAYAFRWIGGYGHSGTVLDVARNRRLSLSWPAPNGLGDTKATFTLRKAGAVTALTISHTGFGRSGAWLGMYAGTQAGWAYYLMNLKSVLENRKDLRHPDDDVTG